MVAARRRAALTFVNTRPGRRAQHKAVDAFVRRSDQHGECSNRTGTGWRRAASHRGRRSALMTAPNYIRWFRDLSMSDLPLVGGKNASLGEMFQQLAPLGVRIPDGFAVTAPAYREALDQAGVWGELHRLLDGLDKRDTDALARVGARAREAVYAAPMPKAVETGIRQAWRELKEQFGEDLSVAVRSSATAEDLPTASFAGQHDTYLNIRGATAVFEACRRCFASLFTDRAL